MKSKLLILGSGTCVSSFYKPFDYISQSAYLLQHKDKNYLIDCSEGVRARLEQNKIDYFTIETIFISHFHPDHFNIETLLQSIFVRVMYKPVLKTVKIYGPKTIRNTLQTIWDLKHGAEEFENTLLKTIQLEFYEYEEGMPIKVDQEITVTPYEVHHVKGLKCFSLRFQVGKKVFTYSGDTGMCEGIKKASHQANYLLCESNTLIQGQIVPFHLRSDEVAQIAKDANVKTVILTHLRGVDSHQDLIQNVQKIFQGNIIIAEDNKVIDLNK